MLAALTVLMLAPASAPTAPTIQGTVEAIRFQNINKARGRFTFNVELRLADLTVEPRPSAWAGALPERLTVRINQSLSWSRFTPAEQARFGAPEQSMKAEAWRGYQVGARARIQVRVTSHALAHALEQARPLTEPPATPEARSKKR